MNKEYGEKIPAIWQMFIESNSEAQRAAIAAHQAASQGSRVFIPPSGSINISPPSAPTLSANYLPDLMLQAVVTLGEKTTEGHVIQAVTIAWFKYVADFLRDPSLMQQLDPRKWEEMLAGAYMAAGYRVTLTPRSGDKGVDVIATLDDLVSIQIIDQMKAYAPGNLVPASDVRDLLGALATHPTASKAIITTTSDFAPGVYEDPEVQRLRPTRLDLRPGPQLIEWMNQIRNKQGL